MKKTKTLKKNIEFKKVLNRGKYYKGKYISVFVIENNKNINKIGLAISVKLTNAVGRNKIKRLIRENYRMMEDDFCTGYEMVFLWNKKVDVKNATFFNLKEDFQKLMGDIGIII